MDETVVYFINNRGYNLMINSNTIKDNIPWEDLHTKVVKRLKEKCKNLLKLGFPTSSDNLILETDDSDNHWGAVLKINQEKICRYASETFKLAEKNFIVMKMNC